MTAAPAIGWIDRNLKRKALELREVKRCFPHFEWGERLYPHRHAFWRGELQPFPSIDQVDAIAGHLAAQESIYVGLQGELSVDTVLAPPVHVPLSTGLTETFLVELIYREPPAVPLVYSLYPKIDKAAFSDHPHLVHAAHPLARDSIFRPRHSLCVFAPHDNVWSWETGTAATILSWTAMWLGAHLIWLARGRSEADWLIPSAPHDPRVLIAKVPATAPCPCGSGLPYSGCCARAHRSMVLGARSPIRLRPHGVHPHSARSRATQLK